MYDKKGSLQIEESNDNASYKYGALKKIGAALLEGYSSFPTLREEQEKRLALLANLRGIDDSYTQSLYEAAHSIESAVSRALIEQFCFAGIWAGAGFPVFHLTKDLVAALALTEYSGTMQDVKLPFDAMLIHLKDCPLKIRGRAISSISTHVFEDSDGWYWYIEARMDGKDDKGQPNTMLWSMLRPYGSDKSGEEWLNRSKEEDPLYEERARLDETPDGMAAKAVRRMMMNLCLYIQMKKETGTLEKKPLPAVRFKKNKHKKAPEVFNLGSEIQLPKTLVDAASGYSASNNRWKIDKRFVVRGHWRNQPCGPKKLDRKRIFIQAHWKGPTTAEAIERLYKVETFNEAGLTDA